MGANDDLDLRRATTSFQNAVRDSAGEKDVNLADYIDGYNEINKLFYRLGRLFGFIADDVKEKTGILAQHGQSQVGERYRTVGSMIAYERYEAKLLTEGRKPVPNELPNGCRTLLRLHRALLFVSKLIDSVRVANPQQQMSELTRKAYDETLAEHHAWGVRKMVHLAVRTLPTRDKVIQVLAGAVPLSDADKVMHEMVDATNAVYQIVQRMYEQHNLQNLP